MGKKNTRVDTELEGKLIDSDEFYRQANSWANMVRNKAAANTAAFSKGKKDKYTYKPRKDKEKTKGGWHFKGEIERPLSKDISFVLREYSGILKYIGFRFPRHGVFVAYGVGGGQPVSGQLSKNVKIRRRAIDWFDEPIDQEVNKLADVAAEFYGDQATINTYAMMIKKT